MSLSFNEFRKICDNHGLYPLTMDEKFWGLGSNLGNCFSFVRWSNNIIVIPERIFDWIKLENGEIKYTGIFNIVPKIIKKDKEEFEKYLNKLDLWRKKINIEQKIEEIEKDF